MRIIRGVCFATALSFSATVGYAQEDARRDVLAYAGNSLVERLNSEQLADLDYYFNCTASGQARSGNLGIIFNALDLRIGGSSFKQQGSCTESARSIDEQALSVMLSSEPFEAAITAWLSCMRARDYNIDVSMFDDSDAAGARLTNTTTGDVSFWVSPSRVVGDVHTPITSECEILPPGAKTGETTAASVEVRLGGRSAVSIACPRTAVDENRGGIVTRVYPAMNIRLTSADAFSVSFPFAERIIGEPAIVNAISDELKTLASTIGELQARISALGSGAMFDGGVSGAANGNASHNPRYPDGMCPDGSYVAGIRSWGANASVRFCVGCFVAVQVICRPLK